LRQRVHGAAPPDTFRGRAPDAPALEDDPIPLTAFALLSRAA